MPKPPLPKGIAKNKRVLLRVNDNDIKVLYELSENLQMPISKIIRNALNDYIKKHKKTIPPGYIY